MTPQMIKDHIDTRLLQFRETPEMWGSREAIELSIIMLLEVEVMTSNAQFLKDNPRVVIDSWINSLRPWQCGPTPFFIKFKDKPNDWYFENLFQIVDKTRSRIFTLIG